MHVVLGRPEFVLVGKAFRNFEKSSVIWERHHEIDIVIPRDETTVADSPEKRSAIQRIANAVRIAESRDRLEHLELYALNFSDSFLIGHVSLHALHSQLVCVLNHTKIENTAMYRNYTNTVKEYKK